MSTTTIRADQPLTTLVNVFTVAPAAQQDLVDLLVTATDEVMRDRPGFISANIHASTDGTRVVNYAQWRTEEDFQSMLRDPAAGKHFAAVYAIASAEPHLYTVESVHHG
ncbi:MAG: antibiotic biosynthesis monooxygenase [Geodermatophilaceae bacterium]|nr:antibiotic biosynthesis monooxygenase [Geodermatophilaceae bacterium]